MLISKLFVIFLISLNVNVCHAFNENKVERESVQNKNSENIEVSLKLIVNKKNDANGVEVPETDIHLEINKNIYYILTVIGFPNEVTDFKKARFPKNSLIACKVWFGGSGEDVYVIRNKSMLEVFARKVDEADEQEIPFKKIKEISVLNAGKLKILKTIIDRSKYR